MTKYYCSECKGFHSKGKLFNKHKELKIEMSKYEIWKLQLRKSNKSYTIKSHKNTYGSKKQ